MNIEIVNEVTNLENGKYKAEIEAIIGYEENEKALIKFYQTEELTQYPWANIFKALNTNNTDDLVGKSVEFEINNHISEKTGYEFSNIKKLRLV